MQQLQSDGSYNELLPKADAWTKDETLSAQVASVLGLRNNYKPDDAFLGLYFGAGTYRYRVRVLFDDGKPCSGCTVFGLTQITGQSLVTDKNGYVLGKSTSTSVTIGVTIPYLDWKTPDSQSIVSIGIITDVVFTLEKVTNMLTVLSSTTSKISSYVKSVDITYVGGGGSGRKPFYAPNYGSGAGADGGYKKGLTLSGETVISIVIGRVQEINSTTSSVTVNGQSLSLDGSWTGKPSSISTGETGTGHLFGENNLMVLGSSGGCGAYVNGQWTSSVGCEGGIGAGQGGSAGYGSENDFFADSGFDATNYGCGGGGGGFACNSKQDKYKAGERGKGKQGAAFFRFYF